MSDRPENLKGVGDPRKWMNAAKSKNRPEAIQKWVNRYAVACVVIDRQEEHIASLESQLKAVDDPELDATDGAHPAWWRGQEHATKATADHLLKVWQEGGEEALLARINELAT
jgi:hypothetical protein